MGLHNRYVIVSPKIQWGTWLSKGPLSKKFQKPLPVSSWVARCKNKPPHEIVKARVRSKVFEIPFNLHLSRRTLTSALCTFGQPPNCPLWPERAMLRLHLSNFVDWQLPSTRLGWPLVYRQQRPLFWTIMKSCGTWVTYISYDIYVCIH